MDLVDIDKVLDDLELDENEQIASPLTRNERIDNPEGKVDPQSNVEKNDEEQSSSGLVQKNEELKQCIKDRQTNKNNFINITNVFSSLNDYVNVDLDRSIRKNNNLLATEGREDDPLAKTLKNNDIEYNKLENNEKIIKKDSDINDDGDEDDDCNDIDGNNTSGSSITTSSPFSFSSGPTPGSSSESCSFVAGLDDDHQKNLKEISTVNTNTTESIDVIKSLENGQVLKETIQVDKKKAYVVDNNDDNDEDEENTSKFLLENEDNSHGLSSISSYLYNENTSSSLPGFSHDIIKVDDCLTSISSSISQQKNDKIKDEDSEILKEETEEKSNILGNANQGDGKDSEKKQVVGFGSTMDEISDTELDSILQEIDSDLQAGFGTSPSPPQTSQSEEPAVMPSSSTASVQSQPQPSSSFHQISTSRSSLQKQTVSADKQQKPGDDIHISDEDDFKNSDSFSQASTIEFADMRLQSDFGITDIYDDRSTSSNSGTKFYDNPELNEKHTNDNNIEITAKIVEETTTTFQNDNTIKQTLQRPNSLDLVISDNTVNINNDKMNNINSTAGQTPPASRLIDSNNETLNDSDNPEQQNEEITSEMHHMNQEHQRTIEDQALSSAQGNFNNPNMRLGKIPPFWIPDNEATSCMQCKQKFSLIKRRHHCRACGQVLCSLCCSQKSKLEFLGDMEVRICVQCHLILAERNLNENIIEEHLPSSSQQNVSASSSSRQPNPNNPMEYCSMIPPPEQVTVNNSQQPISVMVPVGVLKRKGTTKNYRKDKTVIFSDGIRPGCDLTELDNWDVKNNIQNDNNYSITRNTTKLSPIVDETDSYIPKEQNSLPPIYIPTTKTEYNYKDVKNDLQLIQRLENETLKFALQRNFYVFVKIVKLKCCINKTIINFTTFGMHHVGQDEIIILLELDDSGQIPKDIFIHLNDIYRDADKGQPITDLGFSISKTTNFLGSHEHGGFLYIRSTFQCLQEIHIPESPYLIGILIHRWEIPWAKIFPLRLMLRLGAQYRYYPSPHVSIRGRDSVYAEIAQTIINFLADFRNYTYTLATIRGMYIHMEDRKTSVLIPKNRYDQIIKALNNSSDHILALGGNFSKKADGHLVCIQNMESNCPETHTYSTQAINIQGQPRKVTGASFLVLNGALKSTSGLSGKCSIVEDGLMVQILPAKMVSVRNALKNMKDIEIICGPVDATESQTEKVSIQWTENDTEFNIGVKSPIDSKKMDGIPSIRVHSGLNYSNANHIIKWMEVFIIQSDEESTHGRDPIDMSKLSEHIAKSTSIALVSFLDLLAANGYIKIGLRATLHQENVCYEAGSQNTKLAPLYMNALDNELISTLHKQTTMLEIDSPIILELIFHILDK